MSVSNLPFSIAVSYIQTVRFETLMTFTIAISFIHAVPGIVLTKAVSLWAEGHDAKLEVPTDALFGAD